ncbi:cyclopropane fatty acyl phospholipid synthase [Candidatus Woesearchaeota archaeon]|nr:cyclopropane fatty acyl phospholipid synthase [Candidatus Woesearchaeota archaeon]
MGHKEKVQEILALAGITINGNKPYDVQVHNEKFYARALAQGSLGVGESYMDGWWDVEHLDVFFTRLFKADLQNKIKSFSMLKNFVSAKVLNMQSRSRAKKVAKEHYDLGNEFYQAMLDRNMQYTCGYWKHARNLDRAQSDKLSLSCKKLQLQKGDRVLELGCGWGGFARYAAQKCGAHVTGYNISKEQVAFAKEWTKGLPVDIRLADYRDATGTFDAVAAIGMCEHVGYKNYRSFMQLAHDRLKEQGLFLLHTIGGNVSVKTTDPWIEKYIFPHSMLPSMAQLTKAAEGLFVVEDWHNFGPDYDKTLMAWDANFRKHWLRFRDEYGERFYRMWRFYLMSSAGQFRARRIQLWQAVLSKGGLPGGYVPVR